MKRLHNVFIIVLLFSICPLKIVARYDSISIDKIFQKDCLALSFLQRVHLKRKNSDFESVNKQTGHDIKKRKWQPPTHDQRICVNRGKRKRSFDYSNHKDNHSQKNQDTRLCHDQSKWIQRKVRDLKEAIDAGDIKKCQLLLEEKGKSYMKPDDQGKRPLLDIDYQDNVYQNTFLHRACLIGNVDVVRFLIVYGADLKIRNKKGQTALHLAIIGQHFNIVKALLTANKKCINDQDKEGFTALHYFCRISSHKKGFLKCLQLLLDCSARLDIETKRGKLPVHFAVILGKTKVLKVLLTVDSTHINHKDSGGETALHYLCNRNLSNKSDILECLQLLLKNRANLRILNKKEQTCLHLAVLHEKKYLMQAILDVDRRIIDQQDSSGATALHYLCSKRTSDKRHLLECLQLLLDNRANLRILNEKEQTALHLAVMHREKHRVQAILAVDRRIIDYKDIDGATALHYLCNTKLPNKSDLLECLTLLLKSGASVNMQNKKGQTSLQVAVLQGKKEVVQAILDVDSSFINHQDIYGKTPLHCLCSNYRSSKSGILKLLIKFHANWYISSCNGKIPLELLSAKTEESFVKDIVEKISFSNINDKRNFINRILLPFVCEKKDPQLVNLLIKCGANIDYKNTKGQTFLHLAVLAGNKNIVKVLVDKSHLLEQEDENGDTALHYACLYSPDRSIVELLLQNGARCDIPNKKKQTVIHKVAKKGLIEILHSILKYDAQNFKGNVRDIDGKTPLYYAFLNKNMKMVDALLQAGAQLDQDTLSGAVEGGCYDFILRALRNIPDINQKNSKGETLLHVACAHKKINIVKLLLTNGAKADICNKKGEPSFDCVIKMGINNDGDEKDNIKIVELFLKYGNNIVMKQEWLSSLIYNEMIKSQHSVFGKSLQDLKTAFVNIKDALLKQDTDRIKSLFQKNKLLAYMRDEDNKTLLHMACENGNLEMVQWLIEYGVDLNNKDKDKKTPLWYAWFFSKSSAISHYLIQHGADPFIKNDDGCTMLQDVFVHKKVQNDDKIKELRLSLNEFQEKIEMFKTSCQNKDFVFAERILSIDNKKVIESDFKQDALNVLKEYLKEEQHEIIEFILNKLCLKEIVNEQYQDGETLLHLFCDDGQFSIVQLLLESGAEVDKEDSWGNTPLHIAAAAGNIKKVKCLLNFEFNINMKNKDGVTPVFCACMSSNVDMVRYLHGLGANLDIKNNRGESLLQFASFNGDTAMIDCLVGKPKIDIDKKGQTQRVCSNRHIDIIEDLVGMLGCSIEMKEEKGKFLIKIMYEGEQIYLVESLTEQGDVECYSGNAEQITHILAKSKSLPLAELLLKTEIHWSLATLQIFFKQCDPVIVACLLEKQCRSMLKLLDALKGEEHEELLLMFTQQGMEHFISAA